MKLRLLVVALIALASAAVISVPQASAYGPTAGTQLVGGLLSPRGMAIGPAGVIYIAEAGTGGDIVNTFGGDNRYRSGLTGRISKVDPATGTRTTVADKLPSTFHPEEGTDGPADVAFLGSQLYYLQTFGGTGLGFPSNPTGVYKVNASGTVTLVADIGAFTRANPVNDAKPGGVQKDVGPDGNPYSMTVRDGAFYVVDGNQNQIMKVTTAGVVTRLNEFPGHPVTTGITYSGAGPFYVAALGQVPFAPADGKVYQVGVPTGNVSTVASGFSALTDVEFGPGGKLYALQFADQASDPNGPPLTIGTGKILRVDLSTGKLTPLVDGLTFPTFLIFSGDTAYVSNGGLSIPGLIEGAIWKITGFSAIAPITLAPTPAPTVAPAPVAVATATPKGATGVISAPNTGTGSAAGGGGSTGVWALALAAAALGLTTMAAGYRSRGMWSRRRSGAVADDRDVWRNPGA